MKKNNNRDFKDFLTDKLQDPKLAVAYLNEALKDEDERVFLLALKDVIDAYGQDLSSIAKEAQLNRQNLYKMLSKKGNPRWNSLTSLFNVLGLQVQLSVKK